MQYLGQHVDTRAISVSAVWRLRGNCHKYWICFLSKIHPPWSTHGDFGESSRNISQSHNTHLVSKQRVMSYQSLDTATEATSEPTEKRSNFQQQDAWWRHYDDQRQRRRRSRRGPVVANKHEPTNYRRSGGNTVSSSRPEYEPPMNPTKTSRKTLGITTGSHWASEQVLSRQPQST